MSLAALMFSGCQNSESAHHFGNKVFISASSYEQLLRVQVDEKVSEMTYDLTVGMAMPLENDLTVVFTKDESLLENYRHAYYNEDAQLLPESNTDFSSLRTTITAGAVESEVLSLDFKNLDKLSFETDYVVPLTIMSSGDVEVLPSGKTIYLVIRKANLVDVVADIDDNLAWVNWKNKAPLQDMTEFSMEVLVNGNAFINDAIHTIMGIEDLFLIRVGDVDLPKNELNIAFGKPVEGQTTNARGSINIDDPLLEPGKWYHIAVTFEDSYIKVYLDGKLVGEGAASVGTAGLPESVDFTTGESIDGTGRPDEDGGRPRAFWFGFSYSTTDPTLRDFDGMVSEARIWNRALTAEEINEENHFYKIYDPETRDDLVAYWKFNDEKGKVVKDWSQYGNDLNMDHDPMWVQVVLPAEK